MQSMTPACTHTGLGLSLIHISTVILIQTAGVQVNLGNMQQGEIVALYNYMAQMIDRKSVV